MHSSFDDTIQYIASEQFAGKLTIDESFYRELSREKITALLDAANKNNKITELEIQSDQLHPTHFKQIGNLCNLKSLILFDTFDSPLLAENSLQAIRLLQLTSLAIYSNHITDKDCESLKHLSSLKTITINSKLITEKGLQLLFDIPTIEVLSVALAMLNDKTLKCIPRLSISAEKKISLRVNIDISNEGVKLILDKIPNLYALSVNSDLITDEVIGYFTNNHSLSSLELYGKEITRVGQRYIAHLQSSPKPNKSFFMDYLLKAQDSDFLSHIVADHEITELVLTEQQLIKKLNTVKYSMDDVLLVPDMQSYAKSCVAYSIMYLFYKFGIFSEDQINRETELKIYKEIWSKPGADADPKKIQGYLNKFKLNIIVLEDDEFLTKTLLSNEISREPYRQLHQCQLKQKKVNLATSLPKNASLLLFVMNDKGLHSLLCTFENGEYTVWDPANGDRFSDASLHEVMKNSKLNFSGVALKIKPEAYVCKVGIFKRPPPTPKPLVPLNDSRRECVIQ